MKIGVIHLGPLQEMAEGDSKPSHYSRFLNVRSTDKAPSPLPPNSGRGEGSGSCLMGFFGVTDSTGEDGCGEVRDRFVFARL